MTGTAFTSAKRTKIEGTAKQNKTKQEKKKQYIESNVGFLKFKWVKINLIKRPCPCAPYAAASLEAPAETAATCKFQTREAISPF